MRCSYYIYIELYQQNATQWASCQIRKIADAHAPGMPGTFSPRPPVSDPDMHHSTCMTHVPWCMLGSLTNGFLWSRSRGKTFPAFPAHVQPTTLRIWKEAHWSATEQKDHSRLYKLHKTGVNHFREYCLASQINWIRTGLIVALRPANEGRRYKVTPSLIGWAQT